MGPRIAALVVNWNRREDLLRCLASVAQSVPVPAFELHLIVVDNASQDGSVPAVREAFPEATILENNRNCGFAEGNNIGLAHALAAGFEFVLLINNDAVVASDTIGLLLQPLLDDRRIAVCGPAICYLAEPERVWSAGGAIDRRKGEVSSPHYDQPLSSIPEACYAVDHVSGCCMLVRASTLSEVGLLDPRFFMYYEETEWCARMGERGHKLLVNPRALVWHDISPLAQSGSPAIAYYMTRNHLLFLRATSAPLSAWLRTLYSQLRTVASLYLTAQSPERVRGRVPMLLALRDFARGRFGPTTLPRLLR